ncbi:MAG TPA: molybdenum cofactor guanylyltransferase [Gemmatimonadales bacterium]|nr:molybdenum cofactor guanylyltransferase [Gemmatimonadales bacterium]
MNVASIPQSDQSSQSRQSVRGVILAGGEAARFGGRPKGLELVGGERILDRLVAVFVAAFGTPPLLVANDPAAATWRNDLQVVPDIEPGLGALGGILTAVTQGPAPVVLCAWDMPFVTSALLQALARGLQTHDAYLPQSDGHRGLEPLCAGYGPACRAAIARALERGDRRAIAFHPQVKVGILPLEQVRPLGDPATLFFNLNIPDDLAKADALWRHGSSR